MGDATVFKFRLILKKAIRRDTFGMRANILVLIAAITLSKDAVLIYIFQTQIPAIYFSREKLNLDFA